MKFLLLLLAACNLEVTPIKPIVPTNCRDLARVCICNNSGSNCRWVWSCVPR